MIITITGRKNVGKTTLVERLVAEFARRGRRVATIKHTHHDFQADREGTDSWRHRAAGSECAVIVSPKQLALVRTQAGDQELEGLAAEFCAGYDLVLAEGFKEARVPRIEVLRRGFHEALLPDLAPPVAVVSDFPVAAPAPVFASNDVGALVDHLERGLSIAPANTKTRRHEG
ncbi:MAG: molybdopterin-guanine dinucleotide biosynthesis protein B [Armatimonadetes bacterium]|nr:molybdopterin-guanine dinucleotide biosynthesis protein B [Armatimonadota bacterium]